MNSRWIGAALIILGCGGFGFRTAYGNLQQERLLNQLLRAISYMECELSFRFTPIPDLFRYSQAQLSGILKKLFQQIIREFETKMLPDVQSCIRTALEQFPDLPVSVKRILLQMGYTLGAFDMAGQLKEFQSLKEACQKEIADFRQDRTNRLRSYRTLGVCTGIALVILLI